MTIFFYFYLKEKYIYTESFYFLTALSIKLPALSFIYLCEDKNFYFQTVCVTQSKLNGEKKYIKKNQRHIHYTYVV